MPLQLSFWTDLQGLCCEGLHDAPHVHHELADILADLTTIKHEGVWDRSEQLLSHMVGTRTRFLLVFGLQV